MTVVQYRGGMVRGERRGAQETTYAAGKAAVEQISRVASRELGAREITVSTFPAGQLTPTCGAPAPCPRRPREPRR